jgi:hypothetical protein
MKKARERLMAAARLHPMCLPANKLLGTPCLDRDANVAEQPKPVSK